MSSEGIPKIAPQQPEATKTFSKTLGFDAFLGTRVSTICSWTLLKIIGVLIVIAAIILIVLYIVNHDFSKNKVQVVAIVHKKNEHYNDDVNKMITETDVIKPYSEIDDMNKISKLQPVKRSVSFKRKPTNVLTSLQNNLKENDQSFHNIESNSLLSFDMESPSTSTAATPQIQRHKFTAFDDDDENYDDSFDEGDRHESTNNNNNNKED